MTTRTTNDAESYHGRQRYHFRKRSRVGEWVIRNRELHYREEVVCEGIEMGRIKPNEPKKRYSDLTKKILHLQDNATDFLNAAYNDKTYQEFFWGYLNEIGQMMGVKAKKARDASKKKNKSDDECSETDSENEEDEKNEIEPILQDSENEEALCSFAKKVENIGTLRM
uniref:Uncharacterized protein n=2 Tax=Ditylenchus dipsaci TaxID=166011 RepID=A0A915D776_9BILA